MKLFNYEVSIHKANDSDAIKRAILAKAEQNAIIGLVQAQLDLRHHSMLLDGAEAAKRNEAEIKGYTDAIERDHKSINNWENQLKAIKYERETN